MGLDGYGEGQDSSAKNRWLEFSVRAIVLIQRVRWCFCLDKEDDVFVELAFLVLGRGW